MAIEVDYSKAIWSTVMAKIQHFISRRMTFRRNSAVAFFTCLFVSLSGCNNPHVTQKYESDVLLALEVRKDKIQSVFAKIKSDLMTLAQDPEIHSAMRDFNAGFVDIGENRTQILQEIFILDNPHPTGSKDLYIGPYDYRSYNIAHRKIHPWFQDYIIDHGYYDLMMISPAGDVVYSFYKENDFATNLVRDPLVNATGLANLYSEIVGNPVNGSQYFTDLERYAPVYGAPTGFAAQPLFSNSNEFIGILVFQFPLDLFNMAMQTEDENLAVYMVGLDGLYRSKDPRSEEFTELLPSKIPVELLSELRNGDSGSKTMSKNGKSILYGYMKIEIPVLEWFVIGEKQFQQ